MVRQLPEGEQGLREPRYTVMPVSRDDLPVAELGRGHRSQQGQENARKGPLTDWGLHHPPGKSYQAHQAFHRCGQIAQLLLRLLQYQLRPGAARRHGPRPLLRHCVRTVGRMVRSGRRQQLRPGRGNLRPDWLRHAAGQLEPARGQAARTESARSERRWGAAGGGARVRRRPGLAASVVGRDTPETGLGPGASVR